jgi:integrase
LIQVNNSGEVLNKKRVPTVDEFVVDSFEIHKTKRKHFTKINYERNYRLHIQPTFGSRKIDTILPSELGIWQNKLLEKLSPKTVNSIRVIFHTIFKDALKDDLISRNPISLVDAIPKDKSKKINPFSIKEINMILNKIPPKMKAYFAIGFYTGMRTGEIIALKWENIDFTERKIKVRKAIRQGREDTPKTEYSIRNIDIIDVLLPYLEYHRDIKRDDAVYLFETYKNEPYTTGDKIASHYWKPTLKDLGIDYRIQYQMRHTFASQMISNGEDILWVSDMLGHKDSTTTLEKYARYIKQEKKTRGSFLLSQNYHNFSTVNK